MKTIRQSRIQSDEPALEIAMYVVGLLGVLERNAPGKVLPSDKYFKYIVEDSIDSGIGGHFDGYLWARSSLEVDFRFVTKSTALSDFGGFLMKSSEPPRLTRERWISTFADWNGKIGFDYDGREFEAVLSSYMTLTDSIKFEEALSKVYASMLFGKR
jgi:hypothetical protein